MINAYYYYEVGITTARLHHTSSPPNLPPWCSAQSYEYEFLSFHQSVRTLSARSSLKKLDQAKAKAFHFSRNRLVSNNNDGFRGVGGHDKIFFSEHMLLNLDSILVMSVLL